MSDQPVSSWFKWVLIAFVGVLFVGAVCFGLPAIYPEDCRAAHQLDARGFNITYEWCDGSLIWERPTFVFVENLNVTAKDCRFICQLPWLSTLAIWGGDMSDLNFDDIENCQELCNLEFQNVTRFPVSEFQKMAACPIKQLYVISKDVQLNDSDLEAFAKFTYLEILCLGFDNAGVTDACLEYFEKIPTLKELVLPKSSITQEGVEEFQKKRPGVTILQLF